MNQGNKKNNLFISVVIPVFNSEDTIADCLNAMLNQENFRVGKDYQIIVVNDGSTDNTRDIVAGFPEIKLINLAQNSGRIVARRVGVEAACANIVLLIDSRVIALPTLLTKFVHIGYTPVLAGDLGENKYGSGYDTLFYLLRRRYYRPYFPQSSYGRELWIVPANFSRAPKGTTCIFIEKNLFLSVLPEAQDKTVNDDTRILETIVKKKNIKLLRHTDLRVQYKQRTGGPIYRKWLVERGIRFTDYYLEKKPAYFFLLLCSWICLGMFCGCLIFSPFAAGGMLIVAAVSYMSLVFFVAEESRDLIAVATSLLNTLTFFWLGVSFALLKKIIQNVYRY
ncbi:glycosyltransferase family 2 protein [Candidatus Roizmanbacteria bacterium]|nr:glycosyltransferase family 2 protein [Candidatus Roizmanbacteria bacterium]